MALSRLNCKFLNKFKYYRCYSATGNEEYTSTPEYPPILDLSIEKRRQVKRQTWCDTVQNVATVEEKQIKINMPSYYGFHAQMLKEDNIPYNALKLMQHLTRTHLKRQDVLTEYYNKIEVDAVVKSVQKQLEEVIFLEFNERRQFINKTESIAQLEDEVTKNVTCQINRVILNTLSSQFPHVLDIAVDNDVRHEAFWFAGGIDPTANMQRAKKGRKWTEKWSKDPVDRPMQYIGQPTVALRHTDPLLPVIPYSEAENLTFEVPHYKYDPRVLGFTVKENRFGTNVPGFWPGDHSEFGLLSFHKRGQLLNRYFGNEDLQETLDCQGILCSFGWLAAQANYKGFTTFNDITYPIVTQTVITNGQLWSFYVYQLNTLVMHGEHFFENPKRNICFATAEQKLFEKIDSNGKFVGFNQDVLANLLKFYMNVPQERLGLNLTPYLSPHAQRIADYENDEKREWLENEYKHLMSNRPRHRLPYEVYHWEKIYKIDHKTRPMDKRRRPFELMQNPWSRTLDDHARVYIPRKLRPEGSKKKDKFRKVYYP